jgi:hypothetical protein
VQKVFFASLAFFTKNMTTSSLGHKLGGKLKLRDTFNRDHFADVQLSGVATSQNQLPLAQHVQELHHTTSVLPGFTAF